MYYYEQVLRDGKDKLSQHFTVEELACKCCGLLRLAPYFISELESLRFALDFPLKITSGCRCPDHNTSEGGRKGSFHLTKNPKYGIDGACAVDVYWADWSASKKEVLLRIAEEHGWSIGKANTFCHLDKRDKYTNKPRVDFTYEGYTGV